MNNNIFESILNKHLEKNSWMKFVKYHSNLYNTIIDAIKEAYHKNTTENSDKLKYYSLYGKGNVMDLNKPLKLKSPYKIDQDHNLINIINKILGYPDDFSIGTKTHHTLLFIKRLNFEAYGNTQDNHYPPYVTSNIIDLLRQHHYATAWMNKNGKEYFIEEMVANKWFEIIS